MANPIDHVSDTNGAELYRLSRLYTFPDFVKAASRDDTLRPAALPVTVYADPRFKHFPCHNKAAAWLSALYFQEQKPAYHPKDAALIEQRLDGFAKHWGIKAAVDTMRTQWEETHKNADDKLPDTDFGYVWVGEDGSKQRSLRLKNALEVKEAAAWLARYRDELPWHDRHTIASKILVKAARFGASLGEHDGYIERQAGRGICNPAKVVSAIRHRAKLARDNAAKAAMEQLADMVADKPRFALSGDVLTKLAATIDSFDRGSGLATKYSDVLQRPEDIVFESTWKEVSAGAGDMCVMTTGAMYDKTDFAKLAVADVKALFGDEFASRVGNGLDVDPQKVAELAQTLPRNDAELFDQLLSESGVRPITKAAAALPDPAVMQRVGRTY
jgi:hypothetical protein